MFDYFDYGKLANSNVEKIFKDSIELYYSRKYRECIVTLYSLTIYDLFLKLNKLADSNFKDSKSKLKELQKKIKNNDHFSTIENDIIEYYKDNFKEYFYKFVEDIEYLRSLRHKCAHLYLNDLELFIPHESKVRMLICSIYNNLLSMSAPFILNIMDVAQNDIEIYSESFIDYLEEPKEISDKLIKKYYSKMLDNVLQKSLETLFKLTFKTEDEEAKKNINGLYIFLDVLLNYLNVNGKAYLIENSNLGRMIQELSNGTMSRDRLNIIARLADYDHIIMKFLKLNDEIYLEVKNRIMKKSDLMIEYSNFFIEDSYDFLFTNNLNVSISNYSSFNSFLTNFEGYSFDEYCLSIVNRVPNFNAYDEANYVFDFILSKIENISIDYLDKILDRHKRNRQFRERDRAKEDLKKVKKYLMGKVKIGEQIINEALINIKKLIEDEEVIVD